MNDKALTGAQKKAPDYFNPHATPQDDRLETHPLLVNTPEEPSPEEILHNKYPIKIIAAVVVLLVMLASIPVSVYLTQRPTRVFLEAETPTPTPTATATPSPTPEHEDIPFTN